MVRVATRPIEYLLEHSSNTYSTGCVSVMVFGDGLDVVDVFNKYPQLTEVQILGDEHDWKEIVQLCRSFNPDVVLLDSKKSTSDNFYELGKIRELNPDTKVVDISKERLL